MSESGSTSSRPNSDSKSMDSEKNQNQISKLMNNGMCPDLNSVIRVHTLQFLPAKSLYRFQGVCRDWKLQISTPFFAHNQSHSFRSISGLFSQNLGEGPPSFISIDPKSCGVPQPSLDFLPVPVDIRASSVGLLCCQACTDDKSYYICNPVTRKWKKLPKSNADHGPDPSLVLVFEPSVLNFVADYKVICAFRSSDFDDATEFELYSSQEDSWKIMCEVCFGSRWLVPSSGVHVNGVVYWQEKKRGRILAFDLTKDRSQIIRSYIGTHHCMGQSQGKLCRAIYTGKAIIVEALVNIHTNTMQMGSKAEVWQLRHNVALGSEMFDGAEVDRVVVMFLSGDVVVFQNGKRIYLLNLRSKEIKDLGCKAKGDTRFVCYVNSLVSI